MKPVIEYMRYEIEVFDGEEPVRMPRSNRMAGALRAAGLRVGQSQP